MEERGGRKKGSEGKYIKMLIGCQNFDLLLKHMQFISLNSTSMKLFKNVSRGFPNW